MRILNLLSVLTAIIISLLCPVSSIAATRCAFPTTRVHTVIGIVDTRTLRLDNGTQLRLAALLGPASYDSPSAPVNWPPEHAAMKTLAARVLGQDVAVALERSNSDRHQRYIGQVLFREPARGADVPIVDRWLQATMVNSGHARVALTPEIDRACAQILLATEAEAEAAQRGLWRLALYKPKRAEDTRQLRRYRSTYQIVEGVVARVSQRRSAVYLNFGRDWKRDFTAKLSRIMLKRAGLTAPDIRRLHKQAVRIRGWIEKRNGPLITVWRPEQIEIVRIGRTGLTIRHSPPRLLADMKSNNRKKRN